MGKKIVKQLYYVSIFSFIKPSYLKNQKTGFFSKKGKKIVLNKSHHVHKKAKERFILSSLFTKSKLVSSKYNDDSKKINQDLAKKLCEFYRLKETKIIIWKKKTVVKIVLPL